MSERTIKDLQMMQAAPLNVKVRMTQRRIREWVDRFGIDGVYISFSGGKDSTVLLTIAREMYPDIKAVFSDTGLEYPEIREFVKTWDNVDWVRPKMNFRQVIEKYGYPFISKEVSECVWGARKYLTSVIESQSALNERTNERMAWHGQKYRQLCGCGEYAKSQGGGDADNKYRRLRGIGNYSENICREQSTGTSIFLTVGKSADSWGCPTRDTWNGSKQDRPVESNPVLQNRGGGSARDFANLTGIRTNQPRTTDPRLWNSYQQFADSTADGNKQYGRGGQSSDGEYP